MMDPPRRILQAKVKLVLCKLKTAGQRAKLLNLQLLQTLL